MRHQDHARQPLGTSQSNGVSPVISQGLLFPPNVGATPLGPRCALRSRW
jgi:hypothetical protein